jgi:benzoate-CoA ligase
MYNVAHELLHRQTITRGDKIAIYCGRETITYRQLQEEANRFGNVLKAIGLKPGDKIVLSLPDCPDTVAAFLGSIIYGVWPVLVSPDLSESTYAFIVEDSGAAAVLTSTDSAAATVCSASLRKSLCIQTPEMETLRREASCKLDPWPSREDDIAFMLYSSGSTGTPKGVPHRHRDIPFTADTYAAEVLNLTASDICFSASKLFFAYGLGNSLSFPLRFGASVILCPSKPTPSDIFAIIAACHSTIFFAVPTVYNMLLKSIDDTVSMPSLRLCVSAGEALPASTWREWMRLTGLEIIDGVGSTEALHIFISNRPGRVSPGTSGTVVSGYEARIVDSAGSSAPPGEPGHLLIRGKSTTPFYWNRPDKTSETMLEDGWLETGDIYTVSDGCFTFQGRSDDMFKSGGHWVSPALVEQVMREHPAVTECAVTQRMLEGLVKAMAFAIPAAGYQGDITLFRDIRAFILQRLPDYMCPVQIEFCTELPKTETGKIQRFKLREKTLDG